MAEDLSHFAKEHVGSLDIVLKLFGRLRNNDVDLVGGSDNIKRAFVRIFRALIIGCHFQKINLGMKAMSLEHDKVRRK